jgi:predicted NAD/FAD-binding protein
VPTTTAAAFLAPILDIVAAGALVLRVRPVWTTIHTVLQMMTRVTAGIDDTALRVRFVPTTTVAAFLVPIRDIVAAGLLALKGKPAWTIIPTAFLRMIQDIAEKGIIVSLETFAYLVISAVQLQGQATKE